MTEAIRSFADWRVLITGGSSGIGLALGRDLARRGAHVCLAARDAGRLTAAVRAVRSAARSSDQTICSVELDVTSGESVARVVPAGARRARGATRRGRFHIVVGFDSWLIWIAQRFAPGLVRLFTDRVLLHHLREHGDGRAQLGGGAGESPKKLLPDHATPQPFDRDR